MTMYIILNGVDGSGKDTQFEKLLSLFPNCITLREPGGTTEAEVIRDVILNPDYSLKKRISFIDFLLQGEIIEPLTRQYLLLAKNEMNQHGLNGKAEVYLYAASRAETNKKMVAPAKVEQKTLLGRRSVACSMSYQGFAREIGMDFVWEQNVPTLENALPDLEIFLDLSPEVASKRLKGRTEKQDRLDLESDEFHKKTREGYLTFYEKYCPYEHIILEASGSIEEVHSLIVKTINEWKKKYPTDIS